MGERYRRAMKLIAHYIFGLGSSLVVSSYLETVENLARAPLMPMDVLLVSCLIISVSVNLVIDRFGHDLRGGHISRSPRTHTLPRAALTGIAGGLALALGYSLTFYSLKGSPSGGTATIDIRNIFSFPDYYDYLVFSVVGATAGVGHLFLDVWTERGIFVRKHGRWKRFALAHFRASNPLVNTLAIILGLALIFTWVAHISPSSAGLWFP